MIEIRLVEHDGLIRSMHLHGHAEAGAYGEDLVCAGVGAIAIGLCNALDRMKGRASICMKDNRIDIRKIGEDRHTQDILQTAIVQLQGMEERFPKNVTIKKTED